MDLRGDSFSHGHTYVGFGRVRNRGSVMILVRDHRVNGANEAFVVNAVYGKLVPNLRWCVGSRRRKSNRNCLPPGPAAPLPHRRARRLPTGARLRARQSAKAFTAESALSFVKNVPASHCAGNQAGPESAREVSKSLCARQSNSAVGYSCRQSIC